MKELLLLAASGLAREVAEAAERSFRLIGVLDDDPALHGTRMAGIDVLGGMHLAAEYDASLLVCVGGGAGRRSVVHRLTKLGVGDDRYATLVDESVRVPGSCAIGPGSIILAGTVLTADVTLGRHVVVMPHVTLTHDNRVKDYATVAAGVSLGGSVVLGAGCYLGMNSSIRQRVRVGARAVVGMGAVVLSDVPPGEIWVGVPARPIPADVRVGGR
jgi:sugar O-acyltransferase (sialic acid O-acetyltransferase NeuD family)